MHPSGLSSLLINYIFNLDLIYVRFIAIQCPLQVFIINRNQVLQRQSTYTLHIVGSFEAYNSILFITYILDLYYRINYQAFMQS